ncbi:hypothetical protein, partial [Leptospira interrogans]
SKILFNLWVGYGHNRGAGKIFLKVRVSTFMEMIDPGFLVSKNDEILTFQSFTVKYRFVRVPIDFVVLRVFKCLFFHDLIRIKSYVFRISL